MHFPSVFVAHGAPTLLIEDGPAHRFLSGYGSTLGRPRAILVISAHWETPEPVVSAVEIPATIHDFYGFPAALYQVCYPAPGAPWLAERVIELLDKSAIPIHRDAQRGLDHGAWVPLALMYPTAEIPVTQLSLGQRLGPAGHYRLGQALAPLRREGVLLLGSGSPTHNLAEYGYHAHDDPPLTWVSAFAGWIAQAIVEKRIEDLLNYRTRAPHAVRNHPTEEHLLPLFVALGAGGVDASGVRVHQSYTYGVLAMDVYTFDGGGEMIGSFPLMRTR